MENARIKISDHPQVPGIERYLVESTIVYKKTESPQYARVIFDLIYEKKGVPVRDMQNASREFIVSNNNFVDKTTGMKIYPDVVEDGIPYNWKKDADGNILVNEAGVQQKTKIANTALQYDYFKTIVDNKIKTEKELIIEFVAAMDAVQFFD